MVGLRLSELAPCVGDVVEDGGAGVQVLTVAASSEDPLTGVLCAAKILVVDPPGALEVLLAGPDGGLGPTTGAGLKISEVPFEGDLLVMEPGELVVNFRRDRGDEPAAFGAECLEMPGGAGAVARPLLAAFVVPGPGKSLRPIRQVAGSDMDMTLLACPAHGDIGELPAATVVEDMGDVHGGALRTVGCDGVAVTEAFGADVAGTHVKGAAVGRDRRDRLSFGVDRSDSRCL